MPAAVMVVMSRMCVAMIMAVIVVMDVPVVMDMPVVMGVAVVMVMGVAVVMAVAVVMVMAVAVVMGVAVVMAVAVVMVMGVAVVMAAIMISVVIVVTRFLPDQGLMAESGSHHICALLFFSPDCHLHMRASYSAFESRFRLKGNFRYSEAVQFFDDCIRIRKQFQQGCREHISRRPHITFEI